MYRDYRQGAKARCLGRLAKGILGEGAAESLPLFFRHSEQCPVEKRGFLAVGDSSRGPVQSQIGSLRGFQGSWRT